VNITKEYLEESQVFTSIIKDFEEHDASCRSLSDLWLGRKGGFTDFNEITQCDGCDVTFYVEGLHYVEPENNDGWELNYCDCCNRRINH
jgi:hypothetical protein